MKIYLSSNMPQAQYCFNWTAPYINNNHRRGTISIHIFWCEYLVIHRSIFTFDYLTMQWNFFMTIWFCSVLYKLPVEHFVPHEITRKKTAWNLPVSSHHKYLNRWLLFLMDIPPICMQLSVATRELTFPRGKREWLKPLYTNLLLFALVFIRFFFSVELKRALGGFVYFIYPLRRKKRAAE